MTIPHGSNAKLLTPATPLTWQIHRADDGIPRSDGRRILFVESYGAGSHLQVAETLQQLSRFSIDVIRLARGHWRSIALVGHRAICNALNSIDSPDYDAIIFSGPADVRLAKPAIPAPFKAAPIIAYFHESQWTYPASSLDRIPHLINHIETIEECDAAWFNSRYHRDTFFTAGYHHPSPTVRALAREVFPQRRDRAAVVYPPVRVGSPQRPAADDALTIAWSARWEDEKRPDLMINVIQRLIDLGLDPKLHILGCSANRWRDDRRVTSDVRRVIQPESGFLSRQQYEAVLARANIWLSTAEHEFFGIAAIEAALLGATPVVPNDLAYRETLPSAVTYPPGDTGAAANRIAAIHRSGRLERGPWQIDASRFDARRSVRHFDDMLARIINAKS